MRLEIATIRSFVKEVAPDYWLDLYRVLRDLTIRTLIFSSGVMPADKSFIRHRPIFITGAEHSGTTLMISILSRHPNLWAVPTETGIFSDYVSNKRVKQHLEAILNLAQSKNVDRFVEKTPKHINFVERILRWFPDAQMLIMVRDGRDVAVSLKRRGKNHKRAVRSWVHDNKRICELVGDPRIFVVKYENLISDPEAILQDVCAFLGEAYVDDLFDLGKRFYFHDDEKIVPPDSVYGVENHVKVRRWQINQPIYDDSGRWKTEMSHLEAVYFSRKAGGLLAALGYERTNDWLQHFPDD